MQSPFWKRALNVAFELPTPHLLVFRESKPPRRASQIHGRWKLRGYFVRVVIVIFLRPFTHTTGEKVVLSPKKGLRTRNPPVVWV
jgi:hypothetical protein